MQITNFVSFMTTYDTKDSLSHDRKRRGIARQIVSVDQFMPRVLSWII